MRRLLIAACVIGAAGFMSHSASAADGCSYDTYGQLYCLPGAQPGVPYYRGYGYRQGYEGGHHRYGRRGLAYYCSLGNQTPISLRAECRRAGYW